METTGCGTAIVTPFRADGSIDEPALWGLVNWQIDAGIDFIVACGSTGEAATLEEEEWLRAVAKYECQHLIFLNGEGVRRLMGFAERAGIAGVPRPGPRQSEPNRLQPESR